MSSTFIALTSRLDKRDLASATSGFFVMIPLGLIFGIAVSSCVQVGVVRGLLGLAMRGVEGGEEVSLFLVIH